MRCPLCDREGTRGQIHLHMGEAHAEAVEVWMDGATGHMRYRVVCPHCAADYEHRIKPRSRDPQFLERFAAEIRLVAFDMLLNHLEAEHGPDDDDAPTDEEAAPSLPAFGPGGGRAHPGAAGVPLPPGMDMPELPPHLREISERKRSRTA